jgi:hypothetical protein
MNSVDGAMLSPPYPACAITKNRSPCGKQKLREQSKLAALN